MATSNSIISGTETVSMRRNNDGRTRKVGTAALNYGCLVMLAVFFLFPILFMFVSSLKPEKVIFDDLATVVWAFIPRNASLDNYQMVFSRVPFFNYLGNSLLITAVTVGCGLIVNSMIAYSLARLQWRGKGIVLGVIVALIIVPLEVVAIPLLVIVNSLPWIDGSVGWLDSYHVQIIPFIADAFSIYLFYQFFIGIPKDFDEAAIVDGSSAFGIYWRIIVPLSRPVFATVAILQSLAMWNSYLWPLLTVRAEQFRTLPLGIVAFYTQQIQWANILTFATLITLPVLILFIIFQRYFIQSVASSGIKG